MKELYATAILIDDFIDYNHVNIAFDITGVDRELLKKKLEFDYVNHLRELEGANYIAFWNCDLQGFKTEDDIFFITGNGHYALGKLSTVDGKWFYTVLDGDKKVREDLLI